MHFSDTLEAIRKRSAYTLADDMTNHAGTAMPDAPDSDGANLLSAARDAVVEQVDYLIDADEMGSPYDVRYALENMVEEIGDLMDSVPSVATGTIWRTYVDLAAYQTDLYADLYGNDGVEDMTRVASVTLALIAEEMGRQLIDELIEANNEDEEDN